MIRQYTYCPVKIYWRYIIGLSSPRTAPVKRGKRLHMDIWRGRHLIKKQPDETIRVLRKYYVSDETHGLSGIIDILIIREKHEKPTEYIPVEIKTGFTRHPQKQHEMQLATYLVILNSIGLRARYGILYYYDSKAYYKIMYSDSLYRAVIDARDAIRRILSGKYMPRPKIRQAKCDPCEYAKHCIVRG